jgi:hypothetical protein
MDVAGTFSRDSGHMRSKTGPFRAKKWNWNHRRSVEFGRPPASVDSSPLCFCEDASLTQRLRNGWRGSFSQASAKLEIHSLTFESGGLAIFVLPSVPSGGAADRR